MAETANSTGDSPEANDASGSAPSAAPSSETGKSAALAGAEPASESAAPAVENGVEEEGEPIQTTLTADNWVPAVLHEEMLLFVDGIAQELQQTAPFQNTMFSALKQVVADVWGEAAQCCIFGSCASGMALTSSSLDVVIRVPPNQYGSNGVRLAAVPTGRQHLLNCVRELAPKLAALPWCVGLQPQENRACPRIILTTTASHLVPLLLKQGQEPVVTPRMQRRRISMDITFHDEGHLGLPTTARMRSLETELPALRPLVLFLKLFLLTRHLNKPAGGGLSSTACLIIASRFLRDREQRPPGGKNKRGKKKPEMPNLGFMLIDFLWYFGQVFDPSAFGITISRGGGGGYIPRDHPSLMSYSADSMYLQDPLKAECNVGFNAYRIYQIQREFADGLAALEELSAGPQPDPEECAGRPVVLDSLLGNCIDSYYQNTNGDEEQI